MELLKGLYGNSVGSTGTTSTREMDKDATPISQMAYKAK
jgi:hypothetical protein